MRVRMAKGRVRREGMSIGWSDRESRWSDGEKWCGNRRSCSPHPVPLPLAFLLCSAGPQGQEVLASWRRQHSSLVRFVDAGVVSQSLYSLI